MCYHLQLRVLVQTLFLHILSILVSITLAKIIKVTWDMRCACSLAIGSNLSMKQVAETNKTT